MNRTNSQKGFTLVELAVYMVVASIAITLAAHMFTVASVSNVDTRKRAEMGRDIQEMLFFVEDDISRIGAKAFTRTTIGAFDGIDDDGHLAESGDTVRLRSIAMRNDVRWDTTTYSSDGTLVHRGDSSSFYIVDGDTLDQLRFKCLVYDTAGKATGLDSVSYFVDGSRNLWRFREHWNFEGDSAHLSRVVPPPPFRDTILVAANVSKFDVRAGVYMADTVGDTLMWVKTVAWESSTGEDDANKSEIQYAYDSLHRSMQFFFADTTWRHHGESYVMRDLLNNEHLSKTLERGKTYRLDFDMRTNPRMSLYMNRVGPKIAQNDEYRPDTIAMLLLRATTNQLVPGVDTLYLFLADSAGNAHHYSFELKPSATVAGASAKLRLYVALHSDFWWGRDDDELTVQINHGQAPTFTIGDVVLREIHSNGIDFKSNPTRGERERTRMLDISLSVRRTDMRQMHGEAYLEQNFRKLVQIPDNGPAR